METEWVAARMELYRLLRQHRDWSLARLAHTLGYSLSWVKKWRRRFRQARAERLEMFLSHSRAPKSRPTTISQVVVDAILTLRDDLKSLYQRVVGSKPILYHLHLDTRLPALGHYLPRSTHTIWKILKQAGRIPQRVRHLHDPIARPAPMSEWEFDFGMVSLSPDQWLEFFITVDRGTSILVHTHCAERYRADTALLTVARLLLLNGLPQRLRFDRDPRLVGSWATDGYPSAFVRFLLCLGITPDICPPRRPDLKPFVERCIRSVKHECLYVHRPAGVEQADPQLAQFSFTYNSERANQAVSCGNRPPYVAFPNLPALPVVPDSVDPDRWLEHYQGRVFRRRVAANGMVMVDKYHYFIGLAYSGQRVTLHLNAGKQIMQVLHQGKPIKDLAIQGLYQQQFTFQQYLAVMLEDARSLEQHLLDKKLRYAAV